MKLVYLLLLLLPFSASAGTTLYVSKLGDDSDGSTWTKAFKTVQGALDAVPDAEGGHTVLVRPDVYMEANLAPAYKGAQGAYNTLAVDFDGASGSGTSGYAVFDAGDPERGLKSVDWWSNFRESPEFSGVAWDRWRIRHVYATGADAGLFFDLPPKAEPFTVEVEDSVGIGRAFGGGVAHFFARPEEPIVFRRCYMSSLDWWGDAAGAYVRAENETPQVTPDITFEDCTLVGPDNALQAGNPGFTGYSRVALKRCKLISLNFSQPRGTPGSGVIYSTMEGKFLQVDLQDCTLMGYKVFGAGEGEVGYSTSGAVQAYVQFEQEVPAGMHRLGGWPSEVFAAVAPPPARPPVAQKTASALVETNMCEVSPVVWKDQLSLLLCQRPASGGTAPDYFLDVKSVESGAVSAPFAKGYGLGSALVHEGRFYAFASRNENNNWNDVTVFHSADLSTWESAVAITQDPNEHLFNSSVTASPEGFTMAYETNDPDYPAFSIKFAHSKDLIKWTKVEGVVFGDDRYTACPYIHYSDGWYYLLYLERRTPRWHFETWAARSKDLRAWELAPRNPVLAPEGLDEGINASDPDAITFNGQTYLYYNVGDQRTWMNVKRKEIAEPLGVFLAGLFNTSVAGGL